VSFGESLEALIVAINIQVFSSYHVLPWKLLKKPSQSSQRGFYEESNSYHLSTEEEKKDPA
jgi:hypothetical protein